MLVMCFLDKGLFFSSHDILQQTWLCHAVNYQQPDSSLLARYQQTITFKNRGHCLFLLQKQLLPFCQWPWCIGLQKATCPCRLSGCSTGWVCKLHKPTRPAIIGWAWPCSTHGLSERYQPQCRI